MKQEKRFGKRVTQPSAVQIIHELKLMALRQSLDAAIEREAATAESRVHVDATSFNSGDL